LRHQWGLNDLIGNSREKDRVDHRHHAIDAAVVACVDRSFYNNLVSAARQHERSHPELQIKDLEIDTPWAAMRTDLGAALDEVIISRSPQRKLTGSLHEETGVGFIEGVGNVGRKSLDAEFKQVDKIYDAGVKSIVQRHLDKYGNKEKEAFAPGVTVYHNDGKTPIKRVRVVQSVTTRERLEGSKFGARNKEGVVFKWLAYGNGHHVELVRHFNTNKVKGYFVNMMEASNRARGVSQAKQSVVKTDHGKGLEFLMALFIDDLVSFELEGKRKFYRVQKLEATGNRMMFRSHIAASLSDKSEGILLTINGDLFGRYKLERHRVNVLGHVLG
jgi:CRISPR-associated endonuclease Csn1